MDNGIRHIILGIGGSATVDGGMGMAQGARCAFP
ncbi:glycerate kinase [Escherichia coli]